MAKSKPTPLWAKKVRKALIDKDMSLTEFAAEIKVNYNQLSNVLSGTVISRSVQEKCCTYLGIKQ